MNAPEAPTRKVPPPWEAPAALTALMGAWLRLAELEEQLAGAGDTLSALAGMGLLTGGSAPPGGAGAAPDEISDVVDEMAPCAGRADTCDHGPKCF